MNSRAVGACIGQQSGVVASRDKVHALPKEFFAHDIKHKVTLVLVSDSRGKPSCTDARDLLSPIRKVKHGACVGEPGLERIKPGCDALVHERFIVKN
jgi:hypothetical protein